MFDSTRCPLPEWKDLNLKRNGTLQGVHSWTPDYQISTREMSSGPHRFHGLNKLDEHIRGTALAPMQMQIARCNNSHVRDVI